MLSLPQEISFNCIPNGHMTSILKLTNLQDHPIIFKIKTNAPNHYLLSFHTGVVHKKSSSETTITMKPISFNPHNGSINDLFLVQAIALPGKTELSTFFNPAKFQQVFANTPKSSVENYTLKVVLKLDSLSPSSSFIENNESGLMDSVNSADFKSFRGNESLCLDGMDSETLAMSFGKRLSTKSDSQKDFFTKRSPDSPSELDSSRISLTESQTFPKFTEEKENFVKEKDNERKIEDQETGEESEYSREEELMRRSENQKQLVLELSQENTRLKDELMNLKKSTFHAVAKRNEKLNSQNEYQLWHILLTAIFGMMLGALLTPN